MTQWIWLLPIAALLYVDAFPDWHPAEKTRQERLVAEKPLE